VQIHPVTGGVMKTGYATDLTDKEWEIVEVLVPSAKSGGRSPDTDIRKVIDGIFYLVRTGCQWRMLPKDFPPWQTVYGYFRIWKKDGTWTSIHDELRAECRHQEGKEEQATAAIIDSQSVKCSEESKKEDKGYDGGKKNKWKKTSHFSRYPRVNHFVGRSLR
jgi:putative transposase